VCRRECIPEIADFLKQQFSSQPAEAKSAGFLFPGRIVAMDNRLDFDKMNGLLPAVVQDANDGEVLMVGFMNREAVDSTLEGGYVTFFSRTRQQLWTKGETSGNRLRVISIHTDCDCDTLLLRVEVEGGGLVCHRGTRSCFTEAIPMPAVESERSEQEAR
jgi:phosphoribosyl-AMP cyclohydrolase